jgi:hypothetical protein
LLARAIYKAVYIYRRDRDFIPHYKTLGKIYGTSPSLSGPYNQAEVNLLGSNLLINFFLKSDILTPPFQAVYRYYENRSLKVQSFP